MESCVYWFFHKELLEVFVLGTGKTFESIKKPAFAGSQLIVVIISSALSAGATTAISSTPLHLFLHFFLLGF